MWKDLLNHLDISVDQAMEIDASELIVTFRFFWFYHSVVHNTQWCQ